MIRFSIATLTQAEFRLESALALAEASAVAYLPRAGVEAAYTAASGFERVDVFDAGDTQGFMASTREITILSFRGTEQNFPDWLRNLRVAPTDSAMGPVHSGFAIGLDQVWSHVLTLLQEHRAADRRLWLTGHSLGAALATLAGQRLHSAGRAVAGGYTFGQPRLASSMFQQNFDSAFDGRFFRFVNQSDVVPRIPPGYRHVRIPKRITGEGTLEFVLSAPTGEPAEAPSGPLVESDPVPLDDDQYDRLIQVLESRPESHMLSTEAMAETEGQEGLFSFVSDHAISEYIREIEALIEAPADI